MYQKNKNTANVHESKTIIVLTDIKNYSGKFLYCVGMDNYLSSSFTVKRIFDYKNFWLNDEPNKLLELIKNNSGLVIISTYDNYYKSFNRIKFFCENVASIPILIALEKYHNNSVDNDIINLDYKSKTFDQHMQFGDYETKSLIEKSIVSDKNFKNENLKSGYTITQSNVKYEHLDKTFNYSEYMKSCSGLNNMKLFNRKVMMYEKNNNNNAKTKLNNVVVLADEKNYSREFLKCIGMSSGSPYLCTIHVPTKLFTYQIYGLEEMDKKIFEHVKSNSGLIIITSYQKYDKMIKVINLYCENISHLPILIVLENCPSTKTNKLNLKNLISKENVKYEYLDNKFDYSYYIQTGSGLKNIDWFNSNVIKQKQKQKNMLNLEELVKQFVDCELSIENWNHLNRLRLVYFSLVNFGYEKTIDQTGGWLCVCWNRYKNTIGHSHLWNYTLTKFWVDKIYSLILENPNTKFAELYSKHSFLSDGNLHKKYYTNDVLFSNEARTKWIKPNLV